VAPLTESQITFATAALLIAPLAIGGLALINTGLGRSRNAAHAMISALCAASLAACVYLMIGHCWHGSASETARVLSIGGKPWNWVGNAAPFFIGLAPDGSVAFFTAWIGLLGAALAALIPLGGGGERLSLRSLCLSTTLLAGITYPLFAHWSSGGGWLQQLGVNFGLGGGFVDIGGAGSIHVAGGLTALAVTWLLRFVFRTTVKFTCGTTFPATVGVPPVQTSVRSPKGSVFPSVLTRGGTPALVVQVT